MSLDSENYRFDLANSANGSVLYAQGGTRILATICIDSKQIDGDFTPLSVQYIHKAYAIGKFPGGFVKREGKPAEFEILTSRLIDRTLRPLFPKGWCYETSIIIMVLSYDSISDLPLCALKAAAAALYTSDFGYFSESKACAAHLASAVRVGRINGEFIINPDSQILQKSELDLFVSGKDDELLMIEMNTTQNSGVLSEELTIQALELAKNAIAQDCKMLKEKFSESKKTPKYLSLKEAPSSLVDLLKNDFKNEILQGIKEASKSERRGQFESIINQLVERGYEQQDAQNSLDFYKRSLVREMILDSQIRADGRKLNQVRPISIETNILPHAHGSALFTRGQTQALVVCTLGAEADAQALENLGGAQKSRFLFHYNFPSFCVGEAQMLGSPGRRELGHGNLARKALLSSLPKNAPVLRLVSEILESNGSSSMASVCGGSLALKAAGVQTSTLIAGVAMGLVSDEKSGKYAVLTDISGLEDHDGDMDFKVAGNEFGISALQMDIKLGGIDSEILKNALEQAKQGRIHILGEMKKALENLRINYEVLPKIEQFSVPKERIPDIIGQGGKTIRGIIERFGVSIDLDKENALVSISAESLQGLGGARDFILQLVGSGLGANQNPEYEIGFRFKGKIKSVLDFGAFVELPNGGDGLLKAKSICGGDKSKKPSDVLKDLQEIECVIVGINGSKIDLDLA